MSTLMHQRNSSMSILQGRAANTKHQYLSLHQATLAPLEPVKELNDTKINKKESVSELSKPIISKVNPASNTLPAALASPKTKNVKSTHGKAAPSKLNSTQRPKQASNVIVSNSQPNVTLSSKMIAPFSRITYGIVQNNNRGKPGAQLNGPVIDLDVPNIARIAGAKLFNADVRFNNYPPLPPFDDPKFSTLLKNKIDICSYILDFTNLNGQTQEKEIKSRTLCELIELFENNRYISQLNEEQQALIFKMLDRNIFQQDVILRSPLVMYDKCNPISIVEPCWPHLFYCYQILNRFAQVFPNSKHINLDLVRKAINLTQLPDTNERMQLVAFLRTYFDTHKNEQRQILECVSKKLNDQKDSASTPFCAMPLLIFLTHIYTRSFTITSPISAEFMKVMTDAVLPLISHPDLPLYQQNLRQLIVTVISGHSLYASKFLRYIELKWPQTNSQSQLSFFNILTSIWERMDQKDFKPMSKRVFAFIADCTESTNIRLQELALDVWKTATMDNWIGVNGRHAVNAMYEPVLKLSEKNWNKSIAEKASSALTDMCRINKREYQKMKSYINQMKVKRLKPRVPNDTQKGWAAIAKTAAMMAEQRGQKLDFDLNTRLKEFYDLFHNEKKPTLVVSRFIPVLAKHKDEKAEKND